jgi:peptidyl-dipeptidase A
MAARTRARYAATMNSTQGLLGPVLVLALGALAACRSSSHAAPARTAFQVEVDEFLTGYNRRYRELTQASSEAEWTAQTHIVAGDDTNAARVRSANEASAAFTGSAANITQARGYLARKAELDPLQKRQLDAVLFKAAANPQTVPEVVKRRIAAEAAQTEKLYGYTFTLAGKELTPNQIDEALHGEKDLARRLEVWKASKAVGPTLREGLVNLRGLRNETVQALGFHDFFSYMVSEYGMSSAEMAHKIDQLNRELRPVFRELHTWARYELARRYGQPVPDLLPAHWLPNRWGQDWSPLVDVQGFDLDAAVGAQGPDWTIHQAERFYVSLGFPPLPPSFWEKSSLFPVAKDAKLQEEHARQRLAHRPRSRRALLDERRGQPGVVRDHAPRARTHLLLPLVLAARDPAAPARGREPCLPRGHGLAHGPGGDAAALHHRRRARRRPAEARCDAAVAQGGAQLRRVHPLVGGTMFFWERAIYDENLPPEQWNRRWWELAAKYQGIAPPEPRGEEFCDPATKTHINDDPAGYYDYALSFVLLFQLHDHIARKILHEDPHDTNYFAHKEVGSFLQSIMAPGASVGWRELLKEKTGSDLSAKAMVEYFEPLRKWLVEQNKGRKYTLPEI